MRNLTLGIALIANLACFSASASTIRVPQDRSNIQEAINVAVAGDTVLVAPGTYSQHISINGKNVRVLSEAGPEMTAITPTENSIPIVQIFNTNSTTSFEGFTIRNGGTGDGYASGMRMLNSSAHVRNNIFLNNNGGCISLGVGLFVGGGSPIIEGNIFKGNSGCGRTVEFVNGNPIFIRNVIAENSTNPVIFVVGDINFLNNTLARNISASIGIDLNGGSVNQRIENNIIADNLNFGITGPGSQTAISYNDFFNNGSGPISGGVLGPFNIFSDPLFIGGSPLNYHLQRQSPCVDAGNPTAAVPLFGGARVDIGAFEYLYAFSAIQPTGNIVIQKPQFIWFPLRDSTGVVPASYRVIIRPSCNPAAADTSPVIRDTIWKVPNILNTGQEYCWKVIAVSDAGDNDSTSPVFFRVDNPLLLNKLPSNNGVITIRRPSFVWNSIRDTSVPKSYNYRHVLSINPAFSAAETSAIITDTVWKVDHILTYNQDYFWKVIAVSDSGDTIFGNVTSFRITPLLPRLHLPISAIQVRQPTFSWQDFRDTSISDTFSYQVVLSKSSSFSTVEVSPWTTDTLWKVAQKLDLSTIYYWKVEGVSAYGDSIFTDVRSFSVMPLALFPLLPLENAIVKERHPTVVWRSVRDTSITDTFFYRILLAKDGDFTHATESPLLADTSWLVSDSLVVGGIYFWKVLGFYSDANDTIFPGSMIFFREQPPRIIIPGDRPKIQEGIDVALNGDTIYVKPGTYYEHLYFRGKRVKVISQGGPESTTIAKYVDGLPLVNFTTSEDSNTLISGFTLTGANQVSDGAAIKIVNASPRIENNYIIGNSGDVGAIWVYAGAPRIRRNLIANDTGSTAVRISGPGGGELINCTISNNVGDGFQVDAGLSVRVINCIISFNSGYGLRSLNGDNLTSTITYDDVFGNSLGHFFTILPSTGVINDDPMFTIGNQSGYRLSGLSPCIDAGDPAFAVPAGGGNRVDMGVFEFTQLRGDLNGDGIFSATDVVLELNCVFITPGHCLPAIADLNCDGPVTPADVVIILNRVFAGIPIGCNP